jgi:hypothetical protein
MTKKATIAAGMNSPVDGAPMHAPTETIGVLSLRRFACMILAR